MVDALSLYVHIPFCSRKCPYCHFYVVADNEQLKDRLLRALCVECDRIAPLLRPFSIISLYFGGGTPILFGERRLNALLSHFHALLPNLAPDAELTIEANPENVTSECMQALAEMGFNRLSLGAQSFVDGELAILGRKHSSFDIRRAIDQALNADITNISIDLMYEVPTQTVASWEYSLEEAMKLPITHLSLYNLTIEPRTAFKARQKELAPLIPNAEVGTRMYEQARERLIHDAWTQYEISAFSPEQYRSRHNVGYWTGRPFWGFGPSAFSYFEGKRFRNTCSLHRYAKLLEANSSPVDFEEEVTPEKRRRELLAIGLRLLEGVDVEAFQASFGPIDTPLAHTLDSLQEDGLLVSTNGRLALSCRGIFLYDTVASEII